MKGFICILFSFLCLSLSSQDQALQRLLDSIQNESNYPGIVFSYVNRDGGVNAVASGWADVEKSEKMTPEHKLHGGSTGKTVVSTLTMRLIEKGMLSTEDKVEDHLGFNEWYVRIPNHKEITIKHLLQHTSGIERYEFKEAFLSELKKDADRIWTPGELVHFVLDDEPPFEAGKGFTYSDTNYILLGMIIEKIAGEKFYKLANDEVIEPLGVSSFTSTDTRKIDKMAQGYYEANSEYALGFESPFLKKGIAKNNMQFEWTGGGYAYATSDYARLLKKVFEGEAYDREILKLVHDYVQAPEIGDQAINLWSNCTMHRF